MEYEEEEIQVKEVEKEVFTEISMPQVKTLYKYKGQGMGFEKGEVRRMPPLTLHCLTVAVVFSSSFSFPRPTRIGGPSSKCSPLLES